jgi:hypothetical protein
MAETGEASPAGVTFAGFQNVAINDNGQVAFTAGNGSGLYLLSGMTVKAIAVNSQETARNSNTFFDEIGAVDINSRGDVAFIASALGERGGVGVFTFSNNTLREIAFTGDAVPGPISANFQGFANLAINDRGEVALTGSYRGTETGAFLYSGGSLRAAALAGENVPGAGGQFRQAAARSLANDGTMLVQGSIRNGTANSGMFLYRNRALQPLLFTGTPMPGTSSDVFLRFVTSIFIDESGTVAFRGEGARNTGLFTLSGGAAQAVVLAGQTPAGTGGKEIVEFFPLAGNRQGEFAFSASLEDDQFGLFRYSNRAVTLVVASNQTIQGSFARQYIPSQSVSMNGPGTIAFVGSTTMPSTTGVYSAAGSTLGALVTSQTVAPAGRLRLSTSVGINNAGAVAFTSVVAGNGRGLYHSQLGTIRPMLVVDQTAVGAGEGRLGDVDNPTEGRLALTEQQEVALAMRTFGGASEQGIIRASPIEMPQAVALTGAAVPGLAPSTLVGLGQSVINNQRVVTYNGAVSQGEENTEAVIQQRDQTSTVIAAQGQDAPGTGGSQFASFLSKSVWSNDNGDVAFLAQLDDGREALFLHSNGQLTMIAVTGETLPNTPQVPVFFTSVMLNNQKAVVFSADLEDGTGVFLWTDGQFRLVAVSEQKVPGIDGEFESFGPPAINDGGTIAFVGRWGGFEQGIFVFSRNALSTVTITGQDIFELRNRRFTTFFGLALSNRNQIAFAASLDGAEVPTVVVRASPPAALSNQ